MIIKIITLSLIFYYVLMPAVDKIFFITYLIILIELPLEVEVGVVGSDGCC